ncbi:MAG: DUF1549 and DUF1553 domain-containing protein [Phycisphaeraceae bacterium]
MKTELQALLLSTLLCAATLAAPPAMDEPLPDAPPTPTIKALKLLPSSLTLHDGRDSQRVLVLGQAASGEWIDLTLAAKFTPAAAIVALDSEGWFEAKQKGETTVTVTLGNLSASLPVKVITADLAPVRYVRDIQPILSRVGCNAGTCHGAQKGKNGFFLSLRGYDTDYDYEQLVHDITGRRLDRFAPDHSLMLMKPTGEVPHEGGAVLEKGSRHYNTLLAWIEQGAKFEELSARSLKLEVLPKEVELDLPGRSHEVIVLAHHADGSVRDVTREAVMSSSDTEVAKMKGNRVTGIRRGEAAVLVRYEGQFATGLINVMGDRTGFTWEQPVQFNYIDQHIDNKLRKVKSQPSELCTDGEFVRRVYLDLTGVPPTPEVARAFIEDKTPSNEKRDALIDKLVGSEAFIETWTNKWADLLQVNSGQLGDKGTWMFRSWIREAIATNKPYDKFVHELLTAQGGSFQNPAVNYYITLGKEGNQPINTGKITEDITQTFLGVRFNCNKCHDHPFEKWTQNQYYEFGAFFAQVKFKGGRLPGETVVFRSITGGEVQHPKTGMNVAPHVPYGSAEDAQKISDRRDALADWLVSTQNDLFAKSYVNRVWSYFFGRGIIDPVDDIRAGNPPSNPQLLDALAADFIKSGHDMRHLMKTICKSRTYQQSIKPNQWNGTDKVNFARAAPRRLTAEQMLDALAISTDIPQRFAGLPQGMRAAEVADGRVKGDDFTELFGRPNRESACECARTDSMTLSHAMKMIMGPTINDALANGNNRIIKLAKETKDDGELINAIYYAVLCRPATDAEIKTIDFSQGDRTEIAVDLAWALFNSPAFLFNH